MDKSSPGFVVQVLARAPDSRLGVFGRALDAFYHRPGVVLARMTDVSPRVEKFEFTDSDRDFGKLKLTVDNWDNYFFGHPAWVPGNLVRFFWGYPGKIQGPKYGIIDAVRGFQRLEIVCTEQAALSNQIKDRLWTNTTRSLIVAQLVKEGAFPGVSKISLGNHGVPLTPQQFFAAQLAISASVASTFYGAPLAEKPRDYQQSQLTDWEFVRRLAVDVGCEHYVEDDVLHFHPRQLDVRPIKRYEWFTGSGDFLDFSIDEWRVLDRVAVVEVAGRDPIERKNLSAIGSNDTTKRDVLGREGSAAMTTTLRRGADGTFLCGRSTTPTPRADQESVTNLANAQFRDIEQGEVEATVTVIGDPVLKKARLVELVGISRALSGNYYVESVNHRMDKSGYRCVLKVLRNALTALPTTDAPLLDPATAKANGLVVTARPGSGDLVPAKTQ